MYDAITVQDVYKQFGGTSGLSPWKRFHWRRAGSNGIAGDYHAQNGKREAVVAVDHISFSVRAGRRVPGVNREEVGQRRRRGISNRV